MVKFFLDVIADTGGAFLVMIGGMLLLMATIHKDDDLPPYDDNDPYFHYFG